MFSIALYKARAKEMHDLHEAKFKESQLLRMEAIAALRESGVALLQIREVLKDATKNNPVKTDLGVFYSFSDYLSRESDVSATSAYKYIKLAENWDIVLSLGMQDKTDDKTITRSMRLSRTLRIIDWYKEKVAAGYSKDQLTLDFYWEEQEQPKQVGRPTYKELQAEVKALKAEVNRLQTELTKYKLERTVRL